MKNKRDVSWVEASELPENEKVFLKKDFVGWRVVEPWKNEDGSINWFNLLVGGKRNLFILVFIMIITFLFYLGINEMISNYQIIAEQPCKFCVSCFDNSNPLTQLNISTLLE